MKTQTAVSKPGKLRKRAEVKPTNATAGQRKERRAAKPAAGSGAVAKAKPGAAKVGAEGRPATQRSNTKAGGTKKRTPVTRARQAAAPGHTPIYYRLHALLHSVQVIARFEDPLAALLHEAGHTGTLDADAHEELHNLLLDMPSSSYHAELDALHEALHALRERAAA